MVNDKVAKATPAPFNGEMVRLGRQLRALTQRQFSDLLCAEASSLSRIENGMTQLSLEAAEKAADVLEVPVDFFRQQERPYGLPLSVHPMWRAKAAVSQHSIDQALAALNLRIMHVRRLIRSVEFEPVLPLPDVDLASHDGDAARAAEFVRRLWLMPSGPVHDLVQWVERAGCFVMLADLPEAAMSGVTMRVPDMRPCIFLNASMPADRMRHTLAHELGHLILHRYPSEDMEREADAFASAFLMPANDMRPYLAGKKIDLRLLASLKPEWRVSMQSLLYRSATLGYVSGNQERYLWQQFSMNKWRMREPAELDFAQEQPSLVAKLFALHIERLGYSLADLASLAAVHEAELLRMYPIPGDSRPGKQRPQLHIVG